MPDWLSAIILGLIEGATEFIPVSSTGHLLLASRAMGLTGPFWDTFVVMIQLGAILAVTVLYFQRLFGMVLRLPSDPVARRFALAVIIAFLPAAASGVLLHKLIEMAFASPMLICASLIVGGFVLLAVDRWSPTPRHHDATRLPLLTAFGIGLFQCLALIPGVSRSGATIVGGLLLGADRRAAAEFSFFLAIPTMVGAFAYDFYKSWGAIDMSQAGTIAVGFIVSFISGLIVVRAMIGFVTDRGYSLFGWWRILVGGAGLAFLLLH